MNTTNGKAELGFDQLQEVNGGGVASPSDVVYQYHVNDFVAGRRDDNFEFHGPIVERRATEDPSGGWVPQYRICDQRTWTYFYVLESQIFGTEDDY